MSKRGPRPGALDGVRVLDLTQMLAGPYCSMMLADLGATVIKVEPLGGDFIRAVGPSRSDASFSGYFQSVNRGKRSIALDLRTNEGADLLRRLASKSEILLENFRAGMMERLGLPYETFEAVNPQLVYGCMRVR